MKRVLMLTAAVTASLMMGCTTIPEGTENIHLITEKEAHAMNCKFITFAGSASAILINGKHRNSTQIMEKAKRTKGVTHLSYTKGEAGYAFTKANLWKCPNPKYTTRDAETQKSAMQYFGHL